MSRCASIVVAGLSAVGIAGCSSSSSSGNAAPAPSTTATTATPTTSTVPATSTTTIASALKPGDTYVAVGSSIASGFGIPVRSACGRSSRDYPKLVAAKYRLKLTDVTCGAAVIPNVLDTAQGDNPQQIDAVTTDTKLITISVGGNDIIYNGTALACGDPANVCTASKTLAADLAALPAKLKTMIAKLKAKAPSATIVFVTYPREIPAGNCPALSLTDAEAAILRGMGAQLEATFVDVVKDGVVFVDPYIAAGDHTGCAPESQRWVAGHVAPAGFPYHPTALGHQVMAEMISEALGG